MNAPLWFEPAGPANPVLRVDGLDFSYGEGDARNQVLFDISCLVQPGQLVVMTGPSGSGKTTLLTLVGALRSLQAGRIQILGHDLAQVGAGGLVRVRRDIGFIFQMHNLFDSLSAYENVKMAMQLNGGLSAAQMRERGCAMLERLGLGHRADVVVSHVLRNLCHERTELHAGRPFVHRFLDFHAGLLIYRIFKS